MMNKKVRLKYTEYLVSLYDYMVEHGYTVKPTPKVLLNNKKQEDNPFIKTGYFDPVKDAIVLFINNRHIKDVLRTFAHELIHWKQQINGILKTNGYKSEKIIEDKNLVKLESEAFLKGNLAFRSWTEENDI